MKKICLLVNQSLRLLQVGNINTREWPLHGKFAHIRTEVTNLLPSSKLAALGRRNAHKVLQQLGAGLLLEMERQLDSAVQELGNLLNILLLEVPAGNSRCTKTDTTGSLRASIARDCVLVDGNAQEIADLLDLGAGEAEGPQVPENEMVVRSVGLELVTLLNEGVAESLGVGDDLLGVCLELGGSNLEEGSGNRSDRVVVRAALACREDSLVDAPLEIGGVLKVLAEEDQAGTGTTEGLVTEKLSAFHSPDRGEKLTWWW